MRDHPDMYVILDSKYARLDIYQNMLRQAPERSLRERIFPHVEDRVELTAFRTAYPLQNYMLALYHTQVQNRYDDPIAGDFTSRYRAPAVMMWWRDRDLSISLAANARQSRRYRPSFASALEGVGANVYVHSLGDPARSNVLGPGDRRLLRRPVPAARRDRRPAPVRAAADHARLPRGHHPRIAPAGRRRPQPRRRPA